MCLDFLAQLLVVLATLLFEVKKKKKKFLDSPGEPSVCSGDTNPESDSGRCCLYRRFLSRQPGKTTRLVQGNCAYSQKVNMLPTILSQPFALNTTAGVSKSIRMVCALYIVCFKIATTATY